MKDKNLFTLHVSGFHNILAAGPNCRSHPNYDIYKDYMHAYIHTYHFSADCGISKRLKNVEYFNYVDNMITDDARCIREITSRIAIAKSEFNKKIVFFSNLFLDIRKRLLSATAGAQLCMLLKLGHFRK
jgi:hypothetical protein